MDPAAALRAQSEKTAELVRSATSGQMERRTPCSAWDVRTLLNHLCLVCDFCVRTARGERAEPDYETDFIGDDPGGAYERWRTAMVDACSEPGLPERTVHMAGNEMPGIAVILLALMDSVVHRWDLARVVGADADIDPDVARLLLEQLPPFIPDTMRAPTSGETTGSVPFGPVIDVSEDASSVDKLVAFLGRTP